MMKIRKSLPAIMIYIILKNKLYRLILLLLLFSSLYPVGKNMLGAGMAGLWPLINISVINHYPVVFLSPVFNVVQVFLIIFGVCLGCGAYLENRNIILPFFYGYTRKRVFQNCCLSLLAVLFGTYLFYFAMLLIAGLPLEVLYQGNKSLFAQFGAVAAPLNVNNTATAFGYLMLQFIAVLPAVSGCVLMNVLFQKRMLAGGVGGLCYVLFLWLDRAGIGKWYYYQNHFLNITVRGDEVSYSYLSGPWEYLAGVLAYTSAAFVLLKLAEWKFTRADF